MGKSIKRSVMIRVVCALIATLLFSFMTTANIFRIGGAQSDNVSALTVLDQIYRAEVAHYKWSTNLSSALYAGSEFTGSLDYTGCVLGQFLYSDLSLRDAEIEALRAKIEPLHKLLHASAGTALNLAEEGPEGVQQAQRYYQDTILSSLDQLVGMLDQLVARAEALSSEDVRSVNDILTAMHYTTWVCLMLSLVALISLVVYVLRSVVKPLLNITEKVRPLQQGNLDLELECHSQNELGQMANTLGDAMERINRYVTDIDRIMSELAQGNFDVSTSVPYIGDFQAIEGALSRFTTSISEALAGITRAERKVSGHADQLSSGAQSLAQGATEQASAVQELYATVDQLSKGAASNAEAAANAQKSARLTNEQVTLSSHQMEEMVAAMSDISEAAQQIGRIIATIESIAFQTNILALNAAVEAARAGVAGKGFAVVANEVRNLASKSDEAAKATKKLIENAVRATNRGSQVVGEVSGSLSKALELVVESNSAIEVIADAIQQEAESLAQVSEGIGQVSAVVQTNSASSEESAAVSSELFEQVHRLERETSKFKLKQGGK